MNRRFFETPQESLVLIAVNRSCGAESMILGGCQVIRIATILIGNIQFRSLILAPCGSTERNFPAADHANDITHSVLSSASLGSVIPAIEDRALDDDGSTSGAWTIVYLFEKASVHAEFFCAQYLKKLKARDPPNATHFLTNREKATVILDPSVGIWMFDIRLSVSRRFHVDGRNC
jgi:hypothetical protein